MERCPRKQKSPEDPKYCCHASNQSDHEQKHPAKTWMHCEAAKRALLQYNVLSLWTQAEPQ